MILVKQGVNRIAFLEDLRLEKHECRCLPYVAALLAIGWRLVKDGEPNHEDVLHGARHLQDVKTTRLAQLHRTVVWRFAANTFAFEGHLWRADLLARAMQQDRSLLHAAQALPSYPGLLEKLQHQLRHSSKVRRSVSASDPHSHHDQVIVPMEGGSGPSRLAFARMYEREQPI